MLNNQFILFFYKTNVALRKGVIANDDADIEDQVVEESKEKKQEDSKEGSTLGRSTKKERLTWWSPQNLEVR